PLVARLEDRVLAAVGEAVDLAVAVDLAPRPGEHEGVVRALVAGAHLGDRAADPDAVGGRLLGQEPRRRTALGLGGAIDPHGEPGGERLRQHDQPGPGGRRAGDHGGEPGEVGLLVLPDDVVLDDRDLHAAPPWASGGGPPGPPPPSWPSRATASASTSVRRANEKRTRCRPRAGSP